MHVILVEPCFPLNQREFARALHAVGAQVTGIGERPLEALDDDLRTWLSAYEQVRSVVHEPSMIDAVRRVQARRVVDAMEATIEAHILPAAHVREACGIKGTSVQTAFLCRDKVAMKDALRSAGVPCAASASAESAEQVRAFVGEHGYPVILKPRGGAGASGTYKCTDDQELDYAIAEAHLGDGVSIAIEEYIEGHEAFYDTLTINGEIEHEFITHYYPGVLEAMRTRWITPYFITTNRIDSPGYKEVKELGKRVVKALGIQTSATHMEWFYGPKGLKFSEIGCRPPGVGGWDVYNAANEFDLYKEWAMAVVHGHKSQIPSRRYSAAMVSFRPERDGRIVAYDGLEEVRKRFGDCIVASHFPPPGSRTNGIEAGYMANGWMRVRHPDYDELREILRVMGETVRVRAE